MQKRRLSVLGAAKPALDAERLFREQFLPLYPRGVSLELIRTTDANPGQNPAILAAIEETARLFAALAPEALGRTDLALDFSDASVHRLSVALTAEARDALFTRPGRSGGPSLLVHFVTHGALYVGACIVRGHRGVWLVRSPLWETRVALETRAGRAELAPLSWWMRALSDAEVGRHALGDRYRTLVEVPAQGADAWPVLADPSRRLPRLSKPRYDTLHRHLRAHIPELLEVGEHFPSPARFDELGFRFVEATLVGGGRALLLHGPGARGVHLYWMRRDGFVKGAFFDADLAPLQVDSRGKPCEYRLSLGQSSLGDETIVVELSRSGVAARHEMLWWGG